jgi:hypothetical protein
VIANKRAKERLDPLQNPLVVPIDETFDTTKTIELGGTTLELTISASITPTRTS